MGRGRIALRKPSLESARCSAGELTLGELGSEDWDRLERPRVNMLKLGLEAMAAGFPERSWEDVAVGSSGRVGVREAVWLKEDWQTKRGRTYAGRGDGLRRSCCAGCLCRPRCGRSGWRVVPGSWAVAEEKQTGCRMQDGVRCVISERKARECWCLSVWVPRGRWITGCPVGRLGSLGGVVCRSGRGRHGRQHRNGESWLHRRLQGAGDGDQLMEGKEELWGPGKGGPSNRNYYGDCVCIVLLDG